MHYLVTGHTGFKGAWLTLMLKEQGHDVSGLALDPVPGALFETASLSDLCAHDIRGDIRDPEVVRAALERTAPDVVIHMAAQPLVRDSYVRPRWTMETNVMGTLNVLEAMGATSSVRAAVIVTTDKVYRNVHQEAGYVESDPLGGHDPYSASKAMADLLTQSWVASFGGVPTAIARAGNVIGGGDVSADRLLPDLLDAFAHHRPANIRFPEAVRPWQHVLDCLDGYLTLAAALLDGRGAGEWNFGPGRDSFRTVGEVADLAAELWGDDASWTCPPGEHPHEAGLLALDAAKAEQDLGWRNRLGFDDAVRWTIDWTRSVAAGAAPRTATTEQIAAFSSR
jgi:CDP-glucose 4,6-dehydratase